MFNALKKIWNQPTEIAQRLAAGYATTTAARLRSIPADEQGLNLMEYALLAALIGLIIVVAAPPVATAIQGVFTRISEALTQAPA